VTPVRGVAVERPDERLDGMTADRPELAELLDLHPHPEGGWFRETWRTATTVRPDGYDGERATATGIYFLLHPGEVSRWHMVRSDEVWLWHLGGSLSIRLGGRGEAPTDQPGPDEPGPDEPDTDEPGTDEAACVREVTLGPDITGGQHPQFRIPGGVWQSAAPAGAEAVLVSAIVSPGFDFADFRMA
jgi:predicted cupin superfamily sugar epimerase